MLGASYVFYGWITWWWVLLLVGSTVVNWGLAWVNSRLRGERARRVTVVAAVASNLALLGVFKYYDFFVNSVVDTFDSVGISTGRPLLEVALPVGISFFTFQAASYSIDVHRKVIEPAPPLDFAVYLAFFPQLVAGPIVRASEFLPQLQNRLDPRDIDMTRALVLIGVGLFKKIVISTYMATAIVDEVFAAPNRYSAPEIIVGVYAYAIQIYADFSGYTDIAIGIALVMGFRFPDNFDRPYQAVSIQDFWRRWHMTLSRWLRDYLYIPLGGNRGGRARRNRNLFLTMFLGGLWHGAAGTFVVWGAFHGAGMGIERHWQETREKRRPPNYESIAAPSAAAARRWLGRLATFHFVCIGWVFFRAQTVDQALEMLWRSLTAWGGGTDAVNGLLLLTIAAALAAQFIPRVATANIQADASRLPIWVQGSIFGLWLVVVDVLGPEGLAPFIYFQF